MKKTLLSFFISLAPLFLFAQDALLKDSSEKFKIDAELRVRGNVLNGYKALPTESTSPNYLVEQRTRLNLAYQNKKMIVRISVQDVRNWGDSKVFTKTGMFGDSASIDLYEGWAALKIGNFSYLKLGRQEIVLDEARLLSNRNWLGSGLSYDAALFAYIKNDFVLKAALSIYNNDFSNFATDYDPNKMKSMNFIYLSKKFGNLNISLSNIFTGYQSVSSPDVYQFKYTVGPYLKYNNKSVLAKTEIYYQTGKTIDGMDVNAYFLNAEAGYNFGKFYLGAGIDYLSGQDQENTEQFQSFDLLYGARFKYYGNLNYFLIPQSVKFGGLVNPFFKTVVDFNKKNNLSAYFHLFRTQQDVPIDAQNNYDRNLGSELDIMYTYKINKQINIKAGYHIAFPSETLEAFKNVAIGESETPQWLWLAFTFKPTFFEK
jgi:hypothetical protein